MQMNMARAELFEPIPQDNINSTPFVIEFSGILFAKVDEEMKDQKKATFCDM